MTNLKDLLKKLEIAEDTANRADTAYENDPENAELEKAFDEAYKAEWIAFENVVSAICEITDGKIDIKTARTMIKTKRNELLTIAERATQ